jgi:hypothetical protein
MKACFGLLLLCSFLPAATATGTEESLEQTIRFLLDRVASANATFIRNGESHTPAEAAAHMKAKAEHFKAQIKTPEDFIRLAASNSLITGQPYLIRPKAGKEERVAVWLTAILQERCEGRERAR